MILLVALTQSAVVGQVQAVAEEVFRTFTNGEGKMLETKVVSVEVDVPDVLLARRDGSTFLYKIRDLSLQEQIYDEARRAQYGQLIRLPRAEP